MLLACSRGCGEAEDIQEFEPLDEKLLQLPLKFHGVDYAAWEPDVHKTYLTQEGEQNLTRLARALRAAPDQCVTIKGFCGPPVGPKMITLATMRTQVVHDFLKEQGCSNRFEFSALGFSAGDDKGPRVELMLVEPPAEAPEIKEAKVVDVREEVKEVKAPVVQEVQEPVLIEEPPPFLTVSFLDTETKPVVTTWHDKPLGITFSRDELPVLVTKVVKGSKADLLGVQAGMKVSAVEFTGQNMTTVEDMSFGEINDLLTKGVSILPHETDRPYLALTFGEEGCSEYMLKTWYTKPLGFSCSPESPIVVTKVEEGSRAWELGVKVGMEIKCVAFTDKPTLADITVETYDYAMNLIVTGMKALAPAA